MHRRFVLVSAGLVMGLLAAVMTPGGGGVTAQSEAQPTAVVIPDPVFSYDGGTTGTRFDGSTSSPKPQTSDDVDAVKDLAEGTIVVSFDVSHNDLASKIWIYSILGAADSDDRLSEFCFCLDTLGARSFESGSFGNRVSSVRSANGAGRITAVLSVSKTDGTFLMTSQDFGDPWSTQRDSSEKGFFSSVLDIDRLSIGGIPRRGPTNHVWILKGTIYFVDVYEQPFTEQQAKAKIKETYRPVPSAVHHIRTGERSFQFSIEPALKALTTTYRWEFPDGTTSTDQYPAWTAATGRSDPFEDGIPAKVTVTATISTPGKNHGFSETTTFYVAPAGSGTTSHAAHFENWVFKNGEDGFGCFRIPAIVRAGNGDLLAFAEGRPRVWAYRSILGDYAFCTDHHPGISVVMKRSVDNGITWGSLQVVAENVVPTTGHRDVAQNVTPVLDKTGKIVIVYNATEHGYWAHIGGDGVRRVITAWSGDHGKTWNRNPIDSPTGTHSGDITNQVSRPYNPSYTAVYNSDYTQANYNSKSDQRWAANFPTLGHSIQLEHGPAKGRLFMVGTYSKRAGFKLLNSYNYVYWSDDHGETWEIGGVINSNSYFLNEATAVELESGDVLINSRAMHRSGLQQQSVALNSIRDLTQRILTRVSFDSKGNATFGPPTAHAQLSSAAVAAGMTRITTSDQTPFGRKGRIAFTGPNAIDRTNMSLWMSYDEGKNWNAYGLP